MGARFQAWKERAGRLKSETYALYLAYRDPRTPWYARLLAAAVVAYAASPIDLIPDFIPVLGYLDDAILIPVGIALALRMIPAAVMADSRARAREQLAGDRPTSRVVVVILVVIWLALAALAILLFVRALAR